MPKIAFIGAGSFGFTRSLAKDLLTFPILEGSTIVLMDIDAEKLAYIRRVVDRIVAEGTFPAKIVATTNLKTALKGADAVVATIRQAPTEIWRYDVEIPMKFGVDVNIGDSKGPSGIMRFLRTLPPMLKICRGIERWCPNAIFLNYTNPMAMLCRAMRRATSVPVTGLCHSVQGTSKMLARWIGAPYDEITYVSAGVNHQSWFIEFEWNHQDAIPLIRKAIKGSRKIYNQEKVRNEMFLHLGHYVTESSGHNSEYCWWFRKRPDLVAKYCDGHAAHARNLKFHFKRNRTWRSDINTWINDPKPLDLKRGHEYAASIINAYLGGEAFNFNGNVPNTGLITNLPEDACVEVPAYADRRGVNPIYVGALPPQCAALNNVSVAVDEMAVEAALTRDKQLLFQACAYDPLTAAVLSLAEIKKMVDAMLKKNKDYLPQFK